ncbi:MAG: autoinducer binding domain-containing protein, partial [Pseudomonadota bacterium]
RGLHLRFAAPVFLFRTYPDAWNEHYSTQALVMQDPVVAWGLSAEGVIRWSDLAAKDSAGVLDAAANHGLGFGASVSVTEGGSRSLAGFARGDREFSDAELTLLESHVAALHGITADENALDEAALAVIRARSVSV